MARSSRAIFSRSSAEAEITQRRAREIARGQEPQPRRLLVLRNTGDHEPQQPPRRVDEQLHHIGKTIIQMPARAAPSTAR